jgi:hypothetical protein
MKSIIVPIIALTAAAILSAPLAQAAPADSNTRFTLLCKATVNGQLFTQNLEINYQDRKVNGNSAVVADTMITWSTNDFDPYRKTNVVSKHELNRLAGNYRSWTEGAIYSAPPPSYICEKAPQPRF